MSCQLRCSRTVTASPDGLKHVTQSVLLHQRERLQGSPVRCFVANPSASIAVSPLRPQSRQRVVVQKPSEGSRKCQQENWGFLVI